MAIFGQLPDGSIGIFQKIFTMALAIYFTIIVASYTANLAAFLTIQPNPSITGYDDLKGKTIAVLSSSADALYITTTGTNIGQIIYYDTFDDLFQALDGGIVDAVVAELADIQITLNENCKYTMVGPLVNPSGLGFPMNQRLSSLAKGFNYLILEYGESGWLSQETTKWFGTADQCGASNGPNNLSQLGVENFWGLYACFAVVVVVGILVEAIKRFVDKEYVKKLKEKIKKDLEKSDDVNGDEHYVLWV